MEKSSKEYLPSISAVLLGKEEGRTFSNWNDFVSWAKKFNVREGQVKIGYEKIIDCDGTSLMTFPLNDYFLGRHDGYKEELENLYHDIGRFLGIE